MEEPQSDTNPSTDNKSGTGCLRLFAMASVIVLVIALIVAGWVKYNIYASTYTPVELSTKEQNVLNSKLEQLKESAERDHRNSSDKYNTPASTLKPDRYTEKGAKREISLTEKELNALVANTPEVAERVAIDLSDNLVSIKLVVPLDEEIIFLGGKTLRLNIGIILSYDEKGPVVGVKGVSLGGIPLPNAWLGYIKEKNLIEEFGTEGGFWQLFAEGIKDIKIKDGHILVRLNE